MMNLELKSLSSHIYHTSSLYLSGSKHSKAWSTVGLLLLIPYPDQTPIDSPALTLLLLTVNKLQSFPQQLTALEKQTVTRKGQIQITGIQVNTHYVPGTELYSNCPHCY